MGKKNVVLFKAEYLRYSKLPKELEAQNERLALKYGINSFPTVLMLDERGETFGAVPYRGGGPDAFIKRTDAVLATKPKPFVLDPKAPKAAYDGGWIEEDYTKALTVAAQQKRHLLVLITGTTWADSAKALQKDILDTAAFKDFAKANLVLYWNDIPNPEKDRSETTRRRIGFAMTLGVGYVPVAVLKTPDNRRLAAFTHDPEKPELFMQMLKQFVKPAE